MDIKKRKHRILKLYADRNMGAKGDFRVVLKYATLDVKGDYIVRILDGMQIKYNHIPRAILLLQREYQRISLRMAELEKQEARERV